MDKHDFVSNRNGEECLTCGKGPADEVHWQGNNPYYLILSLEGAIKGAFDMTIVDLDRPGWLETLKERLALPGEWHLTRKNGKGVIFSLRVNEGDQPYYTARHIGIVGGGGSRKVVAYSIGKKTKRMRKGSWHDNEDNLWILPWGQICGGADVEYFAKQGMLKGL
jgi:hypothetical protein